MTVLRTWTERDGLLSVIAPLGLAAAASTALVVDLDPDGPAYPGGRTLADLVVDGPTAAELHPIRRGLAVLGNGGVDAGEATEILHALADGWPNLVARVPDPEVGSDLGPLVPVRPLFPGVLRPHSRAPAVWQRTGFAVRPPGPGPTLPRPSRTTTNRLLTGGPIPKSRWVEAWAGVWRLPWE
jgi:hypothetical protein